MASNPQYDIVSGFSTQTKIYHSLRAPRPLPPISQSLSITEYTLSCLHESGINTDTTPFLIEPTSGQSLSYSQFIQQTHSLAAALKELYSLAKNDVAFIVSPSSLHVPVLYFSLMSLGVTISPANPLSSQSELIHEINLSKPVLAFATSQTAGKLPPLPRGTVILDSPEFVSLLTRSSQSSSHFHTTNMNQSDSAAILYSSGTTGLVKAVMLSQRNMISSVVVSYRSFESSGAPVSLIILPLFHVFGLLVLITSAGLGITLVLMDRFDFEAMLRNIEKYKVTYMPVSPPLIVAMVKSELTKRYDLSSLQHLSCGGASLGKEVIDSFKKKFPRVEIQQGYGMTETTAGIARSLGPAEAKRHGSVGRLSEHMEAKIVDPETGKALPPGEEGELWLRGPLIMKGYVGDEKATAETLDSEGWLKTGDLCYFDSEGYLYIVDRLKELIKYKAYQVPPAELEHILQGNSEIADAAVVPYPDEEAGEIPMAFVVRKPGSNITETQVKEFVAKRVAPYKKIRRVAFINAIPKSQTGKFLRRDLVKLAVSGNLSKL